MQFKEVSPEVLYTTEPITAVAGSFIDELKARAAASPRRRARLCAHLDPADRVQEMLIVLYRGGYLQPHKHLGKSESFHIIEGELKVVVFDGQGRPVRTIAMGGYASGQNFYYRLANDQYHTVIPVSEMVAFHETTNGPFDPADTAYAPWAPAEGETKEAAAYQARLIEGL